jgi:lipopolysaccharide transport system permease protein
MAEVKTYEPDNSLKKGYLQIFREIGQEVRANKWLIYQLFRRDFLTGYRQSFFGLLWAFIIPIVSVVTFLILNQSGLFNLGTVNVPYPVYALFGLAFWQLFSTGIIAGTNSLTSAGYIISKINFSKKALVIASMGKTMVAFIIQLALAFVSFAVYVFAPKFWIFLVPVFMIPFILLTLGLGFILSILNGIIRDFGTLLPVLTTFLLFATPVMYAKPIVGPLAVITRFNPLYYLIAVPRDLILFGSSSEWVGFAFSTALAIVVFAVSLIVFHLTETRLAERI